MLQSKLADSVGVPEICPQLNVIQKSMVVDSSPKLTHNDWIKEQSEDSDISLLVQLLKADRLKKNETKENGFLWNLHPFEVSKGPVLKEWTIVSESYIKESSRINFSVCTTQELCSQSNFGMS